MKLHYIFYIVISLMLICCQKKQDITVQERNKDSLQVASITSAKYMDISFPDSNLILKYKVLLYSKNELEIGSLINDKVRYINFKQWDYAEKNAVLIEYAVGKSSDYSEIINQYEVAKKDYDKAKKQFEDEDISSQILENIHTKYEIAKRKYDGIKSKINVEAPFEGTIKEIFVRQNSAVNIGDPLLKLAKTDTLRAKLNISENDINYINKKNTPEIILSNNKIVKGKFDKPKKSIGNDKQYEVEIIFDNLKRELNIKDSVIISIDTKSKNNRILIPKSAVQLDDENNAYVNILRNGQSVAKQEVIIGTITGENIEIISGLKSGDKVEIK